MRKSFSKFALAATLGFALAFTFSCSFDDEGNCSGDKGNDIANYKTKQIGTQVWMAENLDYAVKGSKCYDNLESNRKKYGRLYDWATAKTACPSGWHLPSTAEWNTLLTTVGGIYSIAGKNLKATSGWDKGGNGTDKYGFSALPGGEYDYSSHGEFVGVGYYTLWWSATEDDNTDYADVFHVMCDYDIVNYIGYDKSNLLSVRCIKD